jgi:hypothetical protein
MPSRTIKRARSSTGARVAILLTGLAVAVTVSLGALPAQAPAQEIQKFVELRLDPVHGLIEGWLDVHLPAGRHRIRLRDDLDLVEASSTGRALSVQRAGPNTYSLRIPRGGRDVRLAWRGTISVETSPRGRVFLREDGGFLPAETGWYPTFDDIETFALRLRATVPQGQRFVATGTLAEQEEIDAEAPYSAVYEHLRTDGIVLATGPWLERTLDTDGVRIRTLFTAALDSTHAETYLEHSAEYLRLFSERAGPYPFGSFTIASSPMPVGFAFPGFTLIGERVIPLPFIPRTSLAHELMHNWWGTGVRIDYRDGNWAEGLTTFMADYFLDERRGEDAQTRYRWLLDLAALPFDQAHPLSHFMGGNQGANRIIGYNRGALLFHMLREDIGAEAFDQGTRLIRDRHLFDTASWNDVQRAFSDAAGRELGSFFEAWIRRPGLPEIALHSVRQRPEGEGWVIEGTLEQVQQEAPWPMRIPLIVQYPTASARYVVALDERRADIRLLLDQPAHALEADPGHEVLRRLTDPPTILRTVTLNPETRLLALQEGLEPFASALLGRNPEPTDTFDTGTPLLVMGGTDGLAAWLEAQGLSEAAGSFARRGAARMWTLPATRTVLISADDAGALQQLLGILRHHGHRSYVVQDGTGHTVETGVWSPPDPGLRVELRPF